MAWRFPSESTCTNATTQCPKSLHPAAAGNEFVSTSFPAVVYVMPSDPSHRFETSSEGSAPDQRGHGLSMAAISTASDATQSPIVCSSAGEGVMTTE